MRLSSVTTLVVFLCALAAPLGQARADDPIAARLFPPELIMQHQQAVGIDDKQRDAIVGEVQRLQSQVVELQWKIQAATGELVKLLDAPRVDEARTLAQADTLMGLERDVKRAHLGALVRIRNLLTSDQRAKLNALRK